MVIGFKHLCGRRQTANQEEPGRSFLASQSRVQFASDRFSLARGPAATGRSPYFAFIAVVGGSISRTRTRTNTHTYSHARAQHTRTDVRTYACRDRHSVSRTGGCTHRRGISRRTLLG